jgi:tetratricopeptide (TPR) repeat protein
MQKTYSTAQPGMKAAIELSWQELDPITRNIGQLLSLFAPTVIPWALVEQLSAKSLQFNWIKTDLNWAKKQLYQRQLIEQVEGREDCYQIPPLTRKFLQVKLAVSVQADDLRKTFAQTMVEIAYQIPDTPSPKIIESVKDAIPHLEEVAKTFTTALSNEDLLWLLDRLGRFYKTQELYAIAEPWFVQCLSVAQARLGNYHPDVATTLNNLAGFYYSQGRYTEAQALYKQALVQRKHLLGDEHLDVATTLNNLAALYYSQGRYTEAQPLYEQALAQRKRLLGDEHLDVAATLNNLALLYYAQGRYSKAQPLYQQALAQRKRLLGDEHPDVATTLNNLAALYKCQRDYTKAIPLLLEALEINERLLGVNHPNTVIFRKNLAILMAKRSTSNFLWQRLFQFRKKI